MYSVSLALLPTKSAPRSESRSSMPVITLYNILTMHLILLLSFTCTTISVAVAVEYQLNKCCPNNQQFNEDIECEDFDPDENHTDFRWLPQDILTKLNTSGNDTVSLDDIIINPNYKPLCGENSQEFLVHHVYSDIVEFDLKLFNNEMLLEVLKRDVVHGSNRQFPTASYCVDTAGEDMFAVLLCPCTTMVCVRKCCGEGEVIHGETSCHDEEETVHTPKDWGVRKWDDTMEYYLLTSKLPECQDNEYHHLSTIKYETNESGKKLRLVLQSDGSMKDIATDDVYPANEYCGEKTHNNDEEVVFYCVAADTVADTISQIYGALFLVSAVALLITVAVMVVIQQLRQSNFNKMALAHHTMLMVAFTTTGIVQLSGHTLSATSCVFTSFVIHFSMLAAFFWLNVMSFDIAYTFSGFQLADSVQYSRKRLVCYSVYAWGCSSLITLVTAVVEFSPYITMWKPNFGTAKCFFNDRTATLLFFYGPIACIVFLNLILMIYTAVQIARQRNRNDINQIDNNRQTLLLFVKLFVLMGATWVFEVISWAVGGESYFWIITDVINLLRGVFIFIIFCCKRSVYNLVLNRGLRMCGKEQVLRESKCNSDSRIELENLGTEQTNH